MKRPKRGEVDWASPETLVVIILIIILGMALLYYATTLKARLLP